MNKFYLFILKIIAKVIMWRYSRKAKKYVKNLRKDQARNAAANNTGGNSNMVNPEANEPTDAGSTV